MATTAPKIPCPKCVGSGQVALSEKLTQVLRALRKKGTPKDVHAAILARHGGKFGVTAVCNRLEELRNMGLVDREADGKGWRYFTVNKPA